MGYSGIIVRLNSIGSSIRITLVMDKNDDSDSFFLFWQSPVSLDYYCRRRRQRLLLFLRSLHPAPLLLSSLGRRCNNREQQSSSHSHCRRRLFWCVFLRFLLVLFRHHMNTQFLAQGCIGGHLFVIEPARYPLSSTFLTCSASF